MSSSLQDKRHLHGHPIFIDLSIFYACLLLDHVKPVIPRNVLDARARPSWTAASKLVGEAAVIFDTLATAISASLVGWLPIATNRQNM